MKIGVRARFPNARRFRAVPSLTFHGLLFIGSMNLRAKRQEIDLKCRTRAGWPIGRQPFLSNEIGL
jgi:hypothetical protein